MLNRVINHKYYEKLNLAIVLSEETLTPTKLFNSIIEFEKNFYKMKENFKNLNIVNGREAVVEIIKNTIKK